VEYVPFGEVFIEERDNETWSTPYKFNGKELDEETGLYYYGARYYDPRVSLWLGVDPLAEKYPNVGGYVYCVENPVRYSDPTGMGPKDRVRYARNMVGVAYLQETNSFLRTASTGEALKYMDCAEFVCRIIAKDNITDGVKHMGSGALKVFLDNKSKFEHSDKPQVGDIALWEGHVGIVTGVDKDGKIKVTHARGKGKLSQENPYFITPKQYRDASFYGYYRPINETPDSSNPATISTTNSTNSAPENEKVYRGKTLQEVIVTGSRINKTEEKPKTE